MFENPLLPNRRLKELLELMQRCHALDRRRPGALAREALLAATAIHLLPGDILCGEASDATAKALAPPPKNNELAHGKSIATSVRDVRLPKASRLALCAAMAQGLQAAGTGGLVLALANAGTAEAGWADALECAQRAQLPLLLVCADATGGRPCGAAAALTHLSLAKLAKKLHLPVLPVDGEDAVAVYRVMQECAARARMGEGPAVLWCVLTPQSGRRLNPSAQPIARMKSYLTARGLLPVKTSGGPRS